MDHAVRIGNVNSLTYALYAEGRTLVQYATGRPMRVQKQQGGTVQQGIINASAKNTE